MHKLILCELPQASPGRPAQCFVCKLYVRVIVSEVSDKFSFETFQYCALSFFSQINLQQNFSFHQMLTNISSFMTFTILLSLSRFIFIFVSESVLKSSARYPHTRTGKKHVHMSVPPCWLLLSFDRTTVANTRFLQTGQPHVILYSNLHLSDNFYQYTTDPRFS